MSLSNLQISPIYKSKDCNVIKDFYVPVLSQSKHYDRVSAYFDSKILSLYASGIEHIYMNGGKIRFIFSYDISESDYKMMIEDISDEIYGVVADFMGKTFESVCVQATEIFIQVNLEA